MVPASLLGNWRREAERFAPETELLLLHGKTAAALETLLAVETVGHVSLSKKQAVLYRKTVADMERQLEETEGIVRKDLVLATIMKLKQICSRPDQYLGQQGYAEETSGKLGVLQELCETIRDKREQVLVFTPFRELTGPLAGLFDRNFPCVGLCPPWRNPCFQAG